MHRKNRFLYLSSIKKAALIFPRGFLLKYSEKILFLTILQFSQKIFRGIKMAVMIV